MGLGEWFGDDEDGTPGFGVVSGQVGRKKMKGKGGLGYSGEAVIEVDPVSPTRVSMSIANPLYRT